MLTPVGHTAPTHPPRWRSVTGANEGFMADLPDSPHGPGSTEPFRPPAGLPALLRRQDAPQTQAQAVIGELGLRERLGRLGPFEQIGSSRSGLMVWRDLDVATRCADPTTEEVLDAMRPVLAHPGVREVTYMPQLGSRSPSGGPADQRWYFVLRYVRRTASRGRSTSRRGGSAMPRASCTSIPTRCAVGSRLRPAAPSSGSRTSGTAGRTTPTWSGAWTSTTPCSTTVSERPLSSRRTFARAGCQRTEAARVRSHRAATFPAGSERVVSGSGRRP